MSIASNFPAIKPTLLLDFANTEELDSRITFTRASTATHYGTQTAKAEENLLLQSQAFNENAWQKTQVTATANSIAAPDGTTTADTLTNNTVNTLHIAFQAATLNGQAYAFSVFAKKGTADFVFLRGSDGAAARQAWFNLATGAVGTVETNITVSITDVGNGWYRCVGVWSASSSASANYSVGISETDGVSSYAGTTKDIYLWGAQLEQRSAVTAYTPTTTQPITNYIPQLLTAASGVARFDHNPTTLESLGLLIEEQRTNLVTYSEQFDNAAWTKTETIVAANTIVAPDGALTGDKLIENTANAGHNVNVGSITTSTTAASTFSFYAKAGERSVIQVRIGVQSFANRGQGNVDLSNGAITFVQNLGTATGTTLTATAVGNGWYRVAITTNPNDAASTQMRVFVILGNVAVNSMTGAAYTGNGYSGIYIWGAQLEAGAFPTSYIKTEASQVTRAADAASMTGTNFSSWYNQAEGTLYAEATASGGAPDDSSQISISDNTANNVVNLNWSASTFNRWNAAIATSGVGQTSGLNQATNGAPRGTNTRLAVAYKTNDVSTSFNGSTPATDTSVVLPVVDRLFFANSNGVNRFMNGTIRKLSYYPLRVTNAQLQALTS